MIRINIKKIRNIKKWRGLAEIDRLLVVVALLPLLVLSNQNLNRSVFALLKKTFRKR